MRRIKVINITEDRIDYRYDEKEVKLLVDAVKGILAERDDPRNEGRFLAPVIHYVTEDSECSVWSRAREIIKEWEEIHNGLG
jgi:hypothetical protein